MQLCMMHDTESPKHRPSQTPKFACTHNTEPCTTPISPSATAFLLFLHFCTYFGLKPSRTPVCQPTMHCNRCWPQIATTFDSHHGPGCIVGSGSSRPDQQRNGQGSAYPKRTDVCNIAFVPSLPSWLDPLPLPLPSRSSWHLG